MRAILKNFFVYEVESCAWPLVDLYETSEDLVFEMDVPGIDPRNISLRIYEDLLMIEGVKPGTYEDPPFGGLKFLCVERGPKSFRRVVKIPIPVNTMAGKAAYANGVVTVTFPKLKGRVIKIAVERRGE